MIPKAGTQRGSTRRFPNCFITALTQPQNRSCTGTLCSAFNISCWNPGPLFPFCPHGSSTDHSHAPAANTLNWCSAKTLGLDTAADFLQPRHAAQEQNHLKNHTPASTLNLFSERWQEKKRHLIKITFHKSPMAKRIENWALSRKRQTRVCTSYQNYILATRVVRREKPT